MWEHRIRFTVEAIVRTDGPTIGHTQIDRVDAVKQALHDVLRHNSDEKEHNRMMAAEHAQIISAHVGKIVHSHEFVDLHAYNDPLPDETLEGWKARHHGHDIQKGPGYVRCRDCGYESMPSSETEF